MNKKLHLFFSLSFLITMGSIFAQGSGADGALTVDATTTTICSTRQRIICPSGVGTCTGFESENKAGQKKITIATTGSFAVNDLVLIISMTKSGGGVFEEATVSSITVNYSLNMVANLVNTYVPDSSQVIKIPQYTTVTIQNAGILTCPAYDSSAFTGGVLWFKANSTLTLNSGCKITASGKGYQGGIAGVSGGAGTGGSPGSAGNGTTNGGDGKSGSSSGTTTCASSGATRGTNGARSGGYGGCSSAVSGTVGYLPICPGCPTYRASSGSCTGVNCQSTNISNSSNWTNASPSSMYMGGGGQGGEASQAFPGGAGGGSGGATSAAGSSGSTGSAPSNGGAGGAGGGIIAFYVNTFAGSGSIEADGAAGGNGAAGSTGGNGGNGANGTAAGGGGAGGRGGDATCPGGGGAGGTVWIRYTSSTYTGTVSRVGGSVGAYAAGGNGGTGGTGGTSTGGTGGYGGVGGDGGSDSNWSSSTSATTANNASVANSGVTGGTGGTGGTGQAVGTGGSHCFTTTYSGSGGSGAFLPITLLSLTGKALSRFNLIEWTTATELNNDHFEIESSKDAQSWSKIGTVLGAGNSSTFKSYQMSDERPFEPITYYRLKQVDYSGDFTYSTIIALNQQTSLVHHVVNGDNIDIVVNTIAPVKTEIVNSLGQTVRTSFEEVRGQGVYQVSTLGLSTGLYFLRVSIGDRIETIKFSK